MLNGRIALDHEHGLPEPLQRTEQRVVFAEDHLVIELAVDPSFDDALDVGEVADHVAIVERAAGTSISATALWPCGCLQMPS